MEAGQLADPTAGVPECTQCDRQANDSEHAPRHPFGVDIEGAKHPPGAIDVGQQLDERLVALDDAAAIGVAAAFEQETDDGCHAADQRRRDHRRLQQIAPAAPEQDAQRKRRQEEHGFFL